MRPIYLLLMLLLAEALACRPMVESPEKAAVARESMDQVEMSEGMLRMKSSVPLFSGVVTEAWPNGRIMCEWINQRSINISS